MESPPLHPTIDRNTVSASVLVKTFQTRDVARTVGGAFPGSWRSIPAKP